jgi:hypothetical protein
MAERQGLTGSLGMFSAKEVSANKDWGLVVATAARGAVTLRETVASVPKWAKLPVAWRRGESEGVDLVWSDEV